MKDLESKKQISLVAIANSLELSVRTKETYVAAMKSYIRYCEENSLRQDLDSLKSWIIATKSSSSQAVYIAAAKKVFSEIFRDDPRLNNIIDSLKKIHPTKRDLSIKESKFLTSDEIEELISVSSHHFGIIIRSLFQTGLRISELLNIKHVDCTSIRDGIAYEIKIIGKGNKENTVYLTKDLYLQIKNVFSEEGYLFSGDGGKTHYRREYISFKIQKYGELIGKKIGAHTLRHSRAADLMSRGVSIDKVSKFLNHASINTTASFYLHQKPSLEELGII
jgi:integrase